MISSNFKHVHVCILPLLIACHLMGCSSGPQSLQYGKDACDHCKMILMDKKFGAEIVSVKGKVYRFDDVNCMINFLNGGNIRERDIAQKLVIDFSQPGKLTDAGNAFYVKSKMIKSPMASQVAAFENYYSLEHYKKEFEGIYLTWGELITQYK